MPPNSTQRASATRARRRPKPSTPPRASQKKSSPPVQTLHGADGKPLPDRYQRAFGDGSFTEWSPTPVNKLRMLISGLSGQGKTTFAASIPNAWHLDFEGMANDVVSPRARQFRFAGFSKYDELLKMLVEDGNAGRAPCDHIIFDTLDEFYERVARYLGEKQYHEAIFGGEKGRPPSRDIRDWGEKGSGWQKLRAFVARTFDALSDAGYGWSALLQEYMDPDARELRPCLPDKSGAPIFRKGHIIAEIQRVHRVTTVTKKRTVRGKTISRPTTEARDAYVMGLGAISVERSTFAQAKARYLEFLPEEIILPAADAWTDVFVPAYESAILAARTNTLAPRTAPPNDEQETS